MRREWLILMNHLKWNTEVDRASNCQTSIDTASSKSERYACLVKEGSRSLVSYQDFPLARVESNNHCKINFSLMLFHVVAHNTNNWQNSRYSPVSVRSKILGMLCSLGSERRIHPSRSLRNLDNPLGSSIRRKSERAIFRTTTCHTSYTHTYTRAPHTPACVSAGVGRRLSAAAVGRRCYRVGPDWIYFICFHNYRALRRPAICLLPPVGRSHPSPTDRPRKGRRRRGVEGRKKENGGRGASKQNARERDAAGGKEGLPEGLRLRGGGREGSGWVRGGGHGKSSVRRYRLTDVRLSVVKR